MTGQGDPELGALLREAQLDAALALLTDRVRAAPADARDRLDLAELLILLGEWERADRAADLASTYDPSRAIGIALIRQLIRAAEWRDQTFRERRPPDLVTEPDAAIAAALARLAGTTSDAEEPTLKGSIDGRDFAGLRDLDDRTAGVLEVLTGNGRYLWIPFARLAALRPATPERLRDLVWRPAEVELHGGPSGTVYLPALYPAAAGEGDATHKLGRATDWIEEPDGSTRGIGQRCLLVGEDVVTLDGFAELVVQP
ncbi:type VI secretion system accessory protein TagJ [Sphingomonas jatrophae]|uniref:Type VI secretion system protein ImpE n=1 Tax=Sphingomonas jatrophae TaxID=1166337 RepID=A0A1I6M2I3_9SPHN|nr:type VI secretion system accessory protein TagJ [Sphingomonas jatrophae]SFS09712.1 type VI secretion system protein ImpE [Sphingomonas jatrophae]